MGSSLNFKRIANWYARFNRVLVHLQKIPQLMAFVWFYDRYGWEWFIPSFPVIVVGIVVLHKLDKKYFFPADLAIWTKANPLLHEFLEDWNKKRTSDSRPCTCNQCIVGSEPFLD